MIRLDAVPGCAPRAAPHPPSAREIQRVRAALTDLNRIALRSCLSRVADPAEPIVMYVDSPDKIGLRLDCWAFWSVAMSRCRGMSWQYGVLSERSDWYEVGWHPDATFFGLTPSWRQRFRTAMSPEK